MSSSGELTTEKKGRPWLPMPARDLAHDDDDDDDDDVVVYPTFKKFKSVKDVDPDKTKFIWHMNHAIFLNLSLSDKRLKGLRFCLRKEKVESRMNCRKRYLYPFLSKFLFQDLTEALLQWDLHIFVQGFTFVVFPLIVYGLVSMLRYTFLHPALLEG